MSFGWTMSGVRVTRLRSLTVPGIRGARSARRVTVTKMTLLWFVQMVSFILGDVA